MTKGLALLAALGIGVTLTWGFLSRTKSEPARHVARENTIASVANLELESPPPVRKGDVFERFADAYEVLFNDFELVEKGKFGISRVPHPLQSHRGPLRAGSPGHSKSGLQESQLAVLNLREELQSEGYSFDEAVVSNFGNEFRGFSPLSRLEPNARDLNSAKGSDLGKPKLMRHAAMYEHIYRVSGAIPKGGSADALFEPMTYREGPSNKLNRFAESVLTEIAAKKGPVRRTVDGWQVYAAPIRVKSEKCGSCHNGLKEGDIAAASVLVYRRDKPPAN